MGVPRTSTMEEGGGKRSAERWANQAVVTSVREVDAQAASRVGLHADPIFAYPYPEPNESQLKSARDADLIIPGSRSASNAGPRLYRAAPSHVRCFCSIAASRWPHT